MRGQTRVQVAQRGGTVSVLGGVQTDCGPERLSVTGPT